MNNNLKAKKKLGPLLQTKLYEDTKDPCVVFDGMVWHKFGSGGNVREEKWQILHATADAPQGPWVERPSVELVGLKGEHVAAPGVIFDKNTFHMFVMTEFMGPGGTVEYLTSPDGNVFIWQGTALYSRRKTDEAGIYDSHPCIIHGKKYIVYSGTPKGEAYLHPTFGPMHRVQPDVFLAVSKTDTWEGPWHRLGKIMDHDAVAWHHNPRNHPDYEWGIEGPQLIELPNGKVLLNATCFLPSGAFGTRQRVFFAVSNKVQGPFRSLGPVLDPVLDEWGSGENGHASGLIHDKNLLIFYQARQPFSSDGLPNYWRYGLAIFDPDEIS